MKTKLLLLLFLVCLNTYAQNPTDITQRFGPIPGIGNGNSVAIQPDGKTILGIAGFYQGIPTYGLIRLNPDGSKDTSFNIGTGFDGDVYSIVLQSDGKIIVGGNFISYKGVIQNCLIRLNADGSKDTSFNIGTGFFKFDSINFINSAYLKSIVLQSNGQLIVSGGFTKYQGVDQNNLIRLNADGSKDASFNIGTGFDNTVESIALQTDNQIIVGGNFTKYQGIDQKRLIRLNTDGSKDTSFIIGTGFNNIVNSIKQQSDGKIIIGGGFTIYNSSSQECMIRLDLDGTRDTSFKIGTGFYYGSYPNEPAVYSIFLQPDGKIIVGGKFDSYQGSNHSLTRLNTDGSKDPNFDIGTGFDYDVYVVALQNDGKIMVSGKFEKYQGVNQKGIIRLNSNGGKDSSFILGNGFTDSVRCITLQSDGKILVGGQFTSYNETSQNRLIRFNPDGSNDTTFNIGTGFDNNYGSDEHQVQAIAVQSDGKIIVGGVFNDYNGVTQNSLVRLKPDGSSDTTFNINSGFYSADKYPFYPDITTINVQSDGKIIIGGSFSRYQDVPYNNLIRLNSNGSIDTSFRIGTGFNDAIKSVILQPDGKILVGGSFSSYKGVASKGLIRLNTDGSMDTSFIIVASEIYYAKALALQSDGKILIVGNRPTSSSECFRLNSDGSIDNSFATVINLINTTIYSIVVQTDGKIILGGYQNNNLIRLNSDGSKDTSFDIGTGFKNSTAIYQYTSNIYSLALQPDGQLLAGGEFTTYKGDNQSAYLIRLKGTYVATPLKATATQNNVTCGITGSASVSVYGGKSPYSFLWSNGATTETITGLAAGNYSCTITDVDSATITKSFNITIITDTQKPTITAPPALTINVNSDCTATGVVLGTPINADNCTVSSVTNNAPATYPTGNTTITWTVKDASNNTATATQIVTVKETVLPTITAPATITVNTTSNCTATGVVLGTPITADNCTVSSVTNNAPSAFPLGNTTVTWSVKDISNNTATATQIVTIKDVTLPTITAPVGVTVNATSNSTATGIALGTPVTADNCSVVSVTNNAPSVFPLGNTAVIWTVKDASNNTANATQIVIVKNTASTTLIPDINFENKLITLGIDSGIADGKVLTSNISSLTSLDVSSASITNMTGIQDFIALISLKCNINLITSIDLTKNIALKSLDCSYNKGLISFDLSKNTALDSLDCSYNTGLISINLSQNIALTSLKSNGNSKLLALDVSKNLALTELECNYANLTTLDVSKNINLKRLFCSSNKLENLNLKNGNNINFLNNYINFQYNTNLTCIQVDNVAYSNANWLKVKDATAYYSNNCAIQNILISSAFEDKLIALGIDTDGKNGSVLFTSISNVKSIDISNSDITNLSGIEYFTDLETLICKGNSLTTINVSYNTALKYLDCSSNPLVTLDVSKNILLAELYCDGVVTIINKTNSTKGSNIKLTVLDLSNNPLLTKLSCSNNQIISLDFSKNTLLTAINCSNNSLQNLNVNNGNNTKILNVNFKSNSSLSCIKVDDPVYSNANWAGAKDATATYSKTACTLGIEDVVFDKIALYPNPVKGQLHIDNILLEKVTVYDALGKLIKTTKFTNPSDSNTIDLSNLIKGAYFIYIQSEGTNIARKIIVQ